MKDIYMMDEMIIVDHHHLSAMDRIQLAFNADNRLILIRVKLIYQLENIAATYLFLHDDNK